MLDVELDDEGEVPAAELLFKSMYSTADAGRPLKGADQATLLQVSSHGCSDGGHAMQLLLTIVPHWVACMQVRMQSSTTAWRHECWAA